MTIKVSITQEDDSKDNVHVAIVQRDSYGNPTVHNGHITQLETGERKEFYLHDAQELRVYETDRELV